MDPVGACPGVPRPQQPRWPASLLLTPILCACCRTPSPGAAALHLFVPPVLGCISSLQRNAGFSWSLARPEDITCDLGGRWVKKLKHDMLAHGHKPFSLTPQWSSGGFLVWEGVSGVSLGACRTWVRPGPCGPCMSASVAGPVVWMTSCPHGKVGTRQGSSEVLQGSVLGDNVTLSKGTRQLHHRDGPQMVPSRRSRGGLNKVTGQKWGGRNSACRLMPLQPLSQGKGGGTLPCGRRVKAGHRSGCPSG